MMYGSSSNITRSADDKTDYDSYEEAFNEYRAIANDTSQSKIVRAYCFARMGHLVTPCPWLGTPPDESGYNHFVSAVQLNTECGDAWIGLMSTYGLDPPDHQDKALYDKAAQVLQASGLSLMPEHYRNVYENALERNQI